LSERRRNPTLEEWAACSLDFTVSEVNVQLLWHYVEIDDIHVRFNICWWEERSKDQFPVTNEMRDNQ
jgi:hypothetical protein